MAEDERPRRPAKRVRELRYTSSPDWDPTMLEGELRAGGGDEGEPGAPFRDNDGPDDGGDREPRRPLPPLTRERPVAAAGGRLSSGRSAWLECDPGAPVR